MNSRASENTNNLQERVATSYCVTEKTCLLVQSLVSLFERDFVSSGEERELLTILNRTEFGTSNSCPNVFFAVNRCSAT